MRSRASPSTVWTDSRYRVMVVLLRGGGHVQLLTPTTNDLARMDTSQVRASTDGHSSPPGQPGPPVRYGRRPQQQDEHLAGLLRGAQEVAGRPADLAYT